MTGVQTCALPICFPVTIGGDLDLLNDLGVSEMELLTILDDSELYPDEQLEAIASRLGFGEQFNQVIESN